MKRIVWYFDNNNYFVHGILEKLNGVKGSDVRKFDQMCVLHIFNLIKRKTEQIILFANVRNYDVDMRTVRHAHIFIIRIISRRFVV